MRKTGKVLLVVFLIAQFVIPSSLLAAAVGKFTKVAGDVKQTSGGVVLKPLAGAALNVTDAIVTGENSSATVVFEDESTVIVRENSTFEVKEFQMQGSERKGIFSLPIGRMVADVKKFIGGGSRFEVNTPTAVAGVRGTGFEIVVVMVGTQASTSVACTVGAMSISAVSATGAVISTATIVAGQTAVVTASGITVSATAVGAGASAAGTTGASGTTGAAGTTAGTAGASGTASGAAGAATGAAGTATGTAAGAAAGASGVAAGTAAAAGVTAGTVAAAAAVAAAAVAAVASTVSSDTTTTHHTTTPHH